MPLDLYRMKNSLVNITKMFSKSFATISKRLKDKLSVLIVGPCADPSASHF